MQEALPPRKCSCQCLPPAPLPANAASCAALPPALARVPATLQGCSSVLYFEARKHKDLYLWVAKAPGGPSAKFHVTNGEGAGGRGPGEGQDPVGRRVGVGMGMGLMQTADSGLARLYLAWAGGGGNCCSSTRPASLPPAAAPAAPLVLSPAVHTLEELKLSGNHLKGSRPVLSFDK